MPKVIITLNEEIWKWWRRIPWINLSQLAERELQRLKKIRRENTWNLP